MNFINSIIYIFILFCVTCSGNTIVEYEWIHAPIRVKVIEVTTPFIGYEINFYSNNIESNFKGYRVYTGSTKEEVIQQQVNEFQERKFFTGTVLDSRLYSTTLWCASKTPLVFNVPIRIQIGGNLLANNYNCFTNQFILQPGNFIAVRAGVDRNCEGSNSSNCFPWSEASVAQVPVK